MSKQENNASKPVNYKVSDSKVPAYEAGQDNDRPGKMPKGKKVPIGETR